jgi:hypothetical protein
MEQDIAAAAAAVMQGGGDAGGWRWDGPALDGGAKIEFTGGVQMLQIKVELLWVCVFQDGVDS